MSSNFPLYFWRIPGDDNKSVRKSILDEEKGAHVFFRKMKGFVQARIYSLIKHKKMPTVFLHGSVHVDNYAKTLWGSGMIDFDRSYHGPYMWDIICLLLSLSFRQNNDINCQLDESVISAMKEGYNWGVINKSSQYQKLEMLTNVNPESWELSVKDYMNESRKWAKKFSKQPLPTDDMMVNELVYQFFLNRNELAILDSYIIAKACRATGTFGRLRIIALLESKTNKDDLLLVDIKHALNYLNPLLPHSKFYYTDIEHQAQRMIAASHLYAKSCMQHESYATVNGQEFWGRYVPTFNAKIKENLTLTQQLDFAYCVATQLGIAHANSLVDINVDKLLKHFKENIFLYQNVVKVVQKELILARNYYTYLYNINR